MNVNVLEYGARGDGVTLCTAAIQAAVDACAASGGGRVTVPAGIYITGTIRLRGISFWKCRGYGNGYYRTAARRYGGDGQR